MTGKIRKNQGALAAIPLPEADSCNSPAAVVYRTRHSESHEAPESTGPILNRPTPSSMPAQEKIVDLHALADIVRHAKQAGKRVVHCHGVFDLLHIGHIRHFKEAATFGDVLVVTVTQDRHVNKGPGRPAFTEAFRLEAVAALDCVDFVALNLWPKAVDTIELLKPSIFVKGSEFKNLQDLTGNVKEEHDAIVAVGGMMRFTDDIVFSSSNLINTYLSNLPENLANFMREIRKSYRFEDVQALLDRFRDLRVLVVGESIIDEYQYCQTMGKSGKEPILAARYLKTQSSAGGVLAAANHVSAFSDHVQVLTQLGAVNSHEDFIRDHLRATITPTFLRLADSPTIVKRRFVENYPFQKLFEIYEMNDAPPDEAKVDVIAALERLLPEVDLVIVTDYGHGMIEEDVARYLSVHAPFLAINTQKNAGNHGFNTVSKYPSAHFISVSEAELRLDLRRRTGDLDALMSQTAERLDCDTILATRGESGLMIYDREHGAVLAPAMATTFKDRVGAGDAVYAVAAMAVYLKAPSELIALIANAVGAQAITIIGNCRSVDRATLEKHILHLMK